MRGARAISPVACLESDCAPGLRPSRISLRPAMSTVDAPRLTPSTDGAALVGVLSGVLSRAPSRDTARRPACALGAGPMRWCSGDALGLRSTPLAVALWPGRSSGGSHDSGTCAAGGGGSTQAGGKGG